MNRATQLALNALNHRFYAGIAHEWSETRKHAWPGFSRILAQLPSLPPPGLRVLDVGCGDGRFAQFLAEQAIAARYVGCDASPALLAHARARGLGAQFEFTHSDFVTEAAPCALPNTDFDLICLLGVLHHVPGRLTRQQLLQDLAARLHPRGLLALTIWRLDEDARFSSRVVPFADYNRTTLEPIALDQLESGDTLLRWGNATTPPLLPRYCHFPDERETAQLLAAGGLRIIERFRADGRGGRLNEYALLAH